MLLVDAVGAFDHVSRGAMLRHPDLRPLVPFARQFYGTPSLYTWTDDSGRSHVIAPGEGRKQGDPQMPALCPGTTPLCEVQAQLHGEAIFAFLDDTYVVAPRTGYAHCTMPSAPHCGDIVLSLTVARPVLEWLGRSRQASPMCRVIPMLSYGQATGPFARTSKAAHAHSGCRGSASRLALVTLCLASSLPPPRVGACCHLALCCGAHWRS